jgi:uncharacterized protein YcfL
MRTLTMTTLLLVLCSCASSGPSQATLDARKQRLEEIQALKKGIREREIEAVKANQKAVKKYQAESPEILKKGLKIK